MPVLVLKAEMHLLLLRGVCGSLLISLPYVLHIVHVVAWNSWVEKQGVRVL